jgi:asparagine synthase (glutamine-hydrolysing)
MCGICGIAERDPRREVSESALRAMTRALAHRGPDGEGVVVLGSVGFGNRRLAIVDRSPAGAQPMRNAASTVWVVYNGEIYNYQDQRRLLEQRGYGFQSQSDTEVLLHLYEEFGDAAVERLHGMFAFAIWDSRTRTLLLARDRFGKKPLYYRLTERGLAFGSEIKALLTENGERPAIDPDAINHFLSFDYVPSPGTAFAGILKLPAGHQLVYRDGIATVRRYSSPGYAPRALSREPARELRDALGTAVERRLMGEVPVGVFLSGGLDSSAVVGLLAERGHRRVPTFSIRFREESHDESAYARLVARRFDADHHEFVADARIADELPRVVRQYDEPFGDPSAMPTYMLAREARRHVTVALTGDGGDEWFAGYDRYVKSALAERYLRAPRPLRRAAARLLAWTAPESRRFEHPLRQLARFAALDQPADTLYARWILHFDREQKAALYTPEFLASAGDSAARLEAVLAAADGADLAARERSTDLATYLPDDLMVKTDIATMAHGLEARCPFLDQDVVAIASSLPSGELLRGWRTKRILRRALGDLLPRETLHRGKQGFGVPLGTWLRGELRPLVHELVLGRRALERGYFREDALRRLVEEHESGRCDWQYHLWNLLVLELWHREVGDGLPP